MIINITNRKSKVSDNIRARIEDWLNESQHRYDIITSAQVTLDKTEQHDAVEATVHAAGKDIFAKATGDNMYMALDALADKIDRQLLKLRDKKQHKKGAHKISEDLIAPAEDVVEETAIIDDSEGYILDEPAANKSEFEKVNAA